MREFLNTIAPVTAAATVWWLVNWLTLIVTVKASNGSGSDGLALFFNVFMFLKTANTVAFGVLGFWLVFIVARWWK